MFPIDFGADVRPGTPQRSLFPGLVWFDVARPVLEENFVEAVKVAESVEGDVTLIATSAREDQNVVVWAFVRQFLNYVAAAKTLIENATFTSQRRWKGCATIITVAVRQAVPNRLQDSCKEKPAVRRDPFDPAHGPHRVCQLRAGLPGCVPRISARI